MVCAEAHRRDPRGTEERGTLVTEQNPRLDGRTKRALDMAIARKQVGQESYRAVLAGEITLRRAKELGRSGAPTDTSEGTSGPRRASAGPREGRQPRGGPRPRGGA